MLLYTTLLYLDPGSGSILIQLLIAALMGAAFLIKTFWGRITGFFKSKNKNNRTDDDDL